ncbi:MAG: S-layer homology domain-containing protein [Ruminococcaceae bacterium]|nr:S-layer homology domain-containing protein [Oscillospiraceae bacterium]
MFKFKRLISGAISLVMIVAMMTTAFAAIPNDVIGTDYEEAAQVLGVLDIMVGDKDTGSFRPDDTIIRSEAARVAISALGLQDIASVSSGKTKYPDMPANHWANGYINVATDQGLVIGDDLGNFRPNDEISYAEMITIMVRALGYEPMALSKGGYPTGYLVTASNIGLTNKVPGSGNEGITRGKVAQLVFNALTINLMEQVGFGNDVNYEVVDKTLLYDNLKVEKITAQVMAVGASSINGDSNLKDSQIQIGEKIYNIGKADVREILGFNVDAYIEKDSKTSEKTLLLAIPVEGNNESITVDSDDIEEVINTESSKALRYWVNKDTDKTAKKATIALDAKIMYNGKAGTFEDFKAISSGTITLLDSNTNGDYDIVFVNETLNYVVEEAISSTHKIVDKYGQKTLVLDPEDTNISFTIEKGSEFIEVADLEEWDILTVTQSKDGAFFHIEVSNEKVSGIVEEKDDEKVYIGGEGYKVASNYPNTINLNDEGTFYLDVQGKIAAVDAESRVSTNYAYLNNIEKAAGINKVLELELFTKDGETKLLKTATKIKVNNKSGLSADEALKEIGSNPKLITYELNSDGFISKVTTAKNLDGGIDEDIFSKNLTLSGAVYKSASGKLVSSSGSVTVTDETIVFDIPQGKDDTNDYSIRDKKFFVNDDEYDVAVYDMKEDLSASVIIVTNSTGEADESSSIAVVDKITKTQNSDGLDIEKLYAVQNGKEITISTSESGVLVKQKDGKTVSLEQGDIIQYKTNVKGEIEKITLLFDISNKETESTNTVSDDLQTYYGKVTKKFTGSFNLQVNDGEVMNFAIGNADIYYVNTKANNKNVTVGDAGDIQKFDDLDPERVFVRVYKDEVKEIVIIK